MIIRAIRLKNIRCYGEGPDGAGVMVALEAGVNRIGGKNGHGKSTLIESVGYALFLTRPDFEEKFQMERYFLRHGAKEGEIDVTFSHGAETYRVERGIGKVSRRRSKVIQVSDGSICAENDDEVAGFLCSVLGVPGPERLTELFSKLIGVKQGRLAWPFDSKPTQAKSFFEPLLDVAVFRECFEGLKPVVDQFHEELHQHDKERAAVAGRVQDRADSSAKVAEAVRAVEQIGMELETSRRARAEAAQTLRRVEGLEQAAAAARVKAQRALSDLSTAQRIRQMCEGEVEQARGARAHVEQNQAACDEYFAAAAALAQLETKRVVCDRLKVQRQQFEQAKVQAEARAGGARRQWAELAQSKLKKEHSRTDLQLELSTLQRDFEAGADAFQQAKLSAAALAADWLVLNAFAVGVQHRAATAKSLAERIRSLNALLATWNPARLAEAVESEQRARLSRDQARQNLQAAQQRVKILQEQLKQIANGLCPFLKERCRQFDAEKVRADMVEGQTQVSSLERVEALAQASWLSASQQCELAQGHHHKGIAKRSELQECLKQYLDCVPAVLPKNVLDAFASVRLVETSFPDLPGLPLVAPQAFTAEQLERFHKDFEQYVNALATWSATAGRQISLRQEALREQELARQAHEHKIRTLVSQAEQLRQESAEIDGKRLRLEAELNQQESALEKACALILALDKELEPFATLEEDLRVQRERQARNLPAYEACLRSRELSARLEERLALLARRIEEERTAQTVLSQAQADEVLALKVFDPAGLAAARESMATRHAEVAALGARLEWQQNLLLNERNRLQEFELASAELVKIEARMARTQSAIALAELARRTLRDAAPEVARHLCRRIAARAQTIFNLINHEPATLEWEADNYSLRIGPGERRFAMLSGGEQTKLALAMTLAMIEQFSTLRICIFDEPTYGVDSESRTKLAEAILQAQQSVSLEQVLLVSHDDAFEGKIDHGVFLGKTALTGASPILE